MHVTETSFTIGVDLQKLEVFLKNLEELGSCIPDVKEVQVISPEKSIWKLVGKLGPLSKTFALNATLVDVSPGHIRFVGEGDDIILRGVVDLSSESDTSTIINLRLEIETGGGIISRIVDFVIKNKLQEYTTEFKKRLTEKIKAE